ncbi:MAG: HAD hydrolase family protein, partial [Candidatus Omnitrophica bacterium]|nr:HAD hydrolase family protein [Candidatus Omnitrophota bacterium]
SWENVCFVGDDVIDLPVMKRAGVAVAVSDAVGEVLKAAHYVTHNRGGHGAVREVTDLLLKATGRWDRALSGYEK